MNKPWRRPERAKKVESPKVTCPQCKGQFSYYESKQGRRVWGHCYSSDQDSVECPGSGKVCAEDVASPHARP